MQTQDYTITIIVPTNEVYAFQQINDVTKWWTHNLKGASHRLLDEFTVYFGDVHISTQKITEFIPNKKIVWEVISSQINFVENKQEWINTKIIFELTELNDKTSIQFTHQGLIPAIACYKDCSNAWKDYIENSLFNLITTGKGNPTV